VFTNNIKQEVDIFWTINRDFLGHLGTHAAALVNESRSWRLHINSEPNAFSPFDFSTMDSAETSKKAQWLIGDSPSITHEERIAGGSMGEVHKVHPSHLVAYAD
jgi:hypothetical protein